ncbi:hypothetical protein [Nocardia salmonicida]|uniref:hypothetical protein n=1 Tax=Nocardia salmonicida TaxID=53431 RepID=UPI0036434102
MQTQNNTLTEAVQALDELANTFRDDKAHWQVMRSCGSYRVLAYLPAVYGTDERADDYETFSTMEANNVDLLTALNELIDILADLPIFDGTVLDVLAAETAPL